MIAYICLYAGHYVCAVINTFTIHILFQPSLLNKKSDYIDNPWTRATTDILLGNNTRVGTANECYTGKKKKKVHIINGCIYIFIVITIQMALFQVLDFKRPKGRLKI